MLSLVTVARDPHRPVDRLLQAAAAMRPRPFEVVVVDTVDDGDGPAGHPGDGLPVRHVRLPTGGEEPVPRTLARNHGVAAASGSLLLFVDEDCVPAPDLAGQMRSALCRRGGLVMADVGEPGTAADAPSAAVAPERFRAAAFAVRRRVLQRLGGFCEQYVAGLGGIEDVDLALLAAAADIPISRWRGAVAERQVAVLDGTGGEATARLVRDAGLFHERWGRWPVEQTLTRLRDGGHVDWRPQDGLLEARDPVGAA